MKQPEENDPIDVLLHEQNAYVNDDGFTARVVAALPRRRQSLRSAALLGLLVVGFAVTLLWLPWANLPPFDPVAMAMLNTQVLVPWIAVLTIVASLVWATVAAVESED